MATTTTTSLTHDGILKDNNDGERGMSSNPKIAQEEEEEKEVATSHHQLVWENVEANLRRDGGCATVRLTDIDQKETEAEDGGARAIRRASLHQRAFGVAASAMDYCVSSSSSSSSSDVANIPVITENQDASHATGYHGASASSMSRYNTYREGFVFSNGEYFDVPAEGGDNNPSDRTSFRCNMESLFASMYQDVALQVLAAVERHLQLEPQWFKENLVGSAGSGCQWHVKRYVVPSNGKCETNRNEKDAAPTDDKNDENQIDWLPLHTDPSLVSVVLHDAPGVQSGAMGLQYQAPVVTEEPSNHDTNVASSPSLSSRWEWRQVPLHGHEVATVFVGSVLSHITGGYYPACKHRVIYPSNAASGKVRMAATLFVRPLWNARLQSPPSPKLVGWKTIHKTNNNNTFETWLTRVSRNYGKRAKKKKEKKDPQQQQQDGKEVPMLNFS